MRSQALWLDHLLGFKSNIRDRRLRSYGIVRPLPLSIEYRVRIQYELRQPPHVYVIDPPLQKRDGHRAEHMYADNEPCLYLPGIGEWNSTKLLAETTVPWLLLWLAFYELWLVTGEWDGGGVHPDRETT